MGTLEPGLQRASGIILATDNIIKTQLAQPPSYGLQKKHNPFMADCGGYKLSAYALAILLHIIV